MAKKKLTELQIENFEMTEEGRAYLEYNEKVGGEPIGLVVPFGYPPGVDRMGGPIEVYKRCIAMDMQWERLLGFQDWDIIY